MRLKLLPKCNSELLIDIIRLEFEKGLLFNNFIQSFVYFNDIALVNKTESDFGLILRNAICDECIYVLLIVT